MSRAAFIDLFRQTLTEPRVAGARVMAMGLPPQALWLALALIAVVMSLMLSGALMSVPLPDDAIGEMLRQNLAYSAPMMSALMMWGQSVISVFVLTWIGRMFGGQAALEDMLAVWVWGTIVIVFLGIGTGLVSVLIPPAAPIAFLASLAWSFYIFVAMIAAAHRFDTILKALGVYVVAILALAVGSALLGGAIGLAGTTGG